jgi:hypothetical protein
MSRCELSLDQQIIEFDFEATRALYREHIKVAGADECGCADCKLFASRRATVYPKHLHDLLTKLGVDPMKELEVFELGPEGPSHALYGGWFKLVGEIKDGVGYRPEYSTTQSCHYWFTSEFPGTKKAVDDALIAVEFLVQVESVS